MVVGKSALSGAGQVKSFGDLIDAIGFNSLSQLSFDLSKPGEQWVRAENWTDQLNLRNFKTIRAGEGNNNIQTGNVKHTAKGADPFVLDLDGDGLSLSGLELTSPRFDIEALVPGDGFAEDPRIRTGWIGGTSA